MTCDELEQCLRNAPAEIIVDTEHLPNRAPALKHLLGVSLWWAGADGLYVPFNHWEKVPSDQLVLQSEPAVAGVLSSFLAKRQLVGWNVEHDREWIDVCFGIESQWTIDGRILWYLTDEEQTERGYSLKSAQVKVLGWSERGDAELEAAVTEAKGSLDRGDHYLAPIGVLARYAVLDARSTGHIVDKLRPVFDSGSYWHAHDINRDYARFLARVTRRGVEVDEFALLRAKRFYEEQVQSATERIRQVCANEIAGIEAEMLASRCKGYKTETANGKRAHDAFLSNAARHPRFNPNSPQQRSKLLYNVVGLPVLERTKTGQPKADKKTIAAFSHPSSQAFVELSENEKLLQFTNTYLEHSRNGLIHFPHDTTATVSERLGGFAPYDLNMPFGSEPIMRAFRVRPGTVGIHMDLVSIEPCLIAGFSGDATMLKVYRDGLGDIYLDLCLELFPVTEADQYDRSIADLIRLFHSEYRTDAPPEVSQKDRFGKIRKIAKIIQLAVGYTGTKFTVAKSLTAAGFPTSLERAGQHVNRYWSKFRKVEALAGQLSAIVRKRGYINGLFGRRLYVPQKLAKDALNRFGQHGGHVILRAIVFEIDKSSRELGMYPVLPDIHDSTSWECPEDRVAEGVQIFEQAVNKVNAQLALPVTVKGEIKTFRTFYGLKQNEKV